MNQRGFTAVELAIVLSIAVLLVPIAYQFLTRLDDQVALAAWELDAADAIRTVSEQIRLDARGSARSAEGVGFVRGSCRMAWTVTDAGSLVRHAPGCGGTVALAAHVESLSWSEGGLDLTFTRSLRPGQDHRFSVFLPSEAP